MQEWVGKMKIGVFKCKIFEHGFLDYCSMKVSPNSYSDSSNYFLEGRSLGILIHAFVSFCNDIFEIFSKYVLTIFLCFISKKYNEGLNQNFETHFSA